MKFPRFSSIPQQLRHLQIFSLSSLGTLHISSRFLLLLVETGKCSIMMHSATERGYDDAYISSSYVLIMEH
uniref:Putative ovule protein n=1 Tax=Solanum chacoense TaxID=4108 RepID=A0A0V0HC84_SOLCH